MIMRKFLVLIICLCGGLIAFARVPRPSHKPLPVHVGSMSESERTGREEYKRLYDIYERFAEEVDKLAVEFPQDENIRRLVAKFESAVKSPGWRQAQNPNQPSFEHGIRLLNRLIEDLGFSLRQELSRPHARTPKAVPAQDKVGRSSQSGPLSDAEKYGWSSEHVISKEFRTWVNTRGGKIEASLCHISEDGVYAGVLQKSENKYLRISVGKLSPENRQYISRYIAEQKGKGCLWWKGVYLLKSEIAEIEYKDKARSLLLEKSIGIRDIRIFQAYQCGGLCHYGKYNGDQFYQAPDSLSFWQAGKRGILSDGERLLNQMMYWAGTYAYEDVRGMHRTVPMYTHDYDFAIFLIRNQFGFYDKGDARFEESESEKPKSPTPNGNCISSGSGFFISRDGYVVTNHHVIEGGTTFKVLASTGTYNARLVCVDKETDLALLKVDSGEVSACVFSDRKKENLGSQIFTVGFPQPGLQGFTPKVTKGVISGMEGFRGDLREYQIDASVQPGNSGGPLFDSDGRVVGVIVASLTKGQVVNYAIKKSYLYAFLENCPALTLKESSGQGASASLEDVVAQVRSSCVLVLNYK